MKVCVYGLWHLGCVTSACLAKIGHEVTGLDPDTDVVGKLQQGRAPIFEPGLDELIGAGLERGNLSFTASAEEALAESELIWLAFDTPVDDEDRADVDFVLEKVRELHHHVRDHHGVICSSQLPVGSVGLMEREWPFRPADFACSPENLRLGHAIESFLRPDRIVVGVRGQRTRQRIEPLWQPLSVPVVWMSVESAEMSKHAVNAFLATSVAFTNELAVLCEQVGADAKEVELSLRSEPRIGRKAYVSPGAAFAGGTLARDLVFLQDLGLQSAEQTPLISGVLESNRKHQSWVERKIRNLAEEPGSTQIAVLGLTYKPGTDTLRRSSSVSLCLSLAARGFHVATHDPAIRDLPADLEGKWDHCRTVEEALKGSRILVLATPWPEYRGLSLEMVQALMTAPAVVIDPTRCFGPELAGAPGIEFHSVGTPNRRRLPAT